MSARLTNQVVVRKGKDVAGEDHNGWVLFWALCLILAWAVAWIVLGLNSDRPDQVFGWLTVLTLFSLLGFGDNFLLVFREDVARTHCRWGWGETIMMICLVVCAALLGWSAWAVLFSPLPVPGLANWWPGR